MNEYIVTLHFQGRLPALECRERAPSIPAAVAQAERYARASGFVAPITKRFCKEVAK